MVPWLRSSSMIRDSLFRLVLLSCASSIAAQGQVLVVDAAGGPGSDFTDVPSAVSAAVDGDVLLVRSGSYLVDELAIALDGKGLTLVADSGASVAVGSLDVQDLPAGHFTLLQGLDLHGEGK